MVRIGMDDKINYLYGNGRKPPELNGGEWGPTRAQEEELQRRDAILGAPLGRKKVCTCFNLPCTCGA